MRTHILRSARVSKRRNIAFFNSQLKKKAIGDLLNANEKENRIGANIFFVFCVICVIKGADSDENAHIAFGASEQKAEYDSKLSYLILDSE